MDTPQTIGSIEMLPGSRTAAVPRWLVAACALSLVAATVSAASSHREETFGDDAPALEAVPGIAIQTLDFDARAGATVLSFTASGPLLHNTSYEAGDQLIIEIPGADVSKLQAIAEIGTPEVDSVIVEAVPGSSGTMARLTIRRAPGMRKSVTVDPANPRRLQVTISPDGFAPATAAAPVQVAAAPPAAAPGRRLASSTAAQMPDAPAPKPQPVAPEQVAALRAQAEPVPAAPVRVAAPEPAPAFEPQRGPGRLVDARIEKAQDGRTVLRLSSTGKLRGQAFILDTPPPRLVVDLPGTVNEISAGSIPVRDAQVLKIRVAQNQPLPEPVTRVVIELKSEGVPFQIVDGPNALLVVLGRAETAAPAMAQLDPALSFPQGAAASPQAAGPAGQDLLTLPSGAGFENLGRPSTAGGTAPSPMRETADASGAVKVLAGDSSTYQAVQVSEGQATYTGEPISLSMKDAELQDVFRLFHQFTGLNIIVDSSVRGKTITLELVDVPWDQALQLVLQTNGLGQQLDGNVLRIAPLAKLAAEEQQKKQWQEAQDNSGELESRAFPLSYASSQASEQMIRKSLSPRGDIQTDRRTNTVFVKDLPKRLEEVQKLISLLDTPTRQVQIEARIIETTVDFSKSTGVRWGFNYIADRAYGNQTGFSFPRSVNTDYAVNLPAQSANSVLGLSFRNILNTFALDLQLQALESRGKARVISRPMVMVQNNQRAEISSGFQIPITNTTATETDVTFVPATLSLNVQPQITADNNVIMDIEVHNDTPGFLVGDNPSIATRNAKTVVAVPNGGTTVIGGIYTVNEGNSSGRVPFLSRVPLLGWLFRNKAITRTNDELLIFLTPRIQSTE